MMGPGRRGGRLSSSGGIARLAGRRGRRRGAWLGCRRAARLRQAFVEWGLRGPGGLAGRPGLLPARLLGGCRGRVGGEASVASTQLPVASSNTDSVVETPCGAVGGTPC